MRKKSLIVGMFLSVALFTLVAFALTTQAAVTVDGTNYEIEISGGVYDLDEIWADGSVNDMHIVNYTDGTWLLNWSLVVDADAAFDPSQGVTGCTWIKLNTTNATGHDEAHISVQGFAYFNDTQITGWNYTGNCNMTYNGSFRPYIYVLPTSHTDTPWCSFKNCTVGYLGVDVDNKYGIVYEDDLLESTDIDSSGYMHNCTVMENYQGITFQGCENMDVSDTYFNDTLEAGIVYTIGAATGGGSHGGNIGDTGNLDLPAGQYSKVQILDCHVDITAMGIRIYGSNNITMEDVEIINATTEGLWVETVTNLTASSVIVNQCTNAADDYQISLNNVTNSTFTSCSAYAPNGDADGGNWYIGDSLGSGWSAWNEFVSCTAYGSAAHEDFLIDKAGSHHNNFTLCTCNNSVVGFYIWYAHNNTISHCVAHNHTYYSYKIDSGDYNRINDSFANNSAVGIYIIDTDDSDLAHHNTLYLNYIYRPTSYGVSVGTDGGTDNWCHNNTIDDVRVYGTTTGDGIYFFDNVTYNNATDCIVTSLAHASSVGFGMSNYAHHNTFHASLSHANENTGFALTENAHDNEFVCCTGSSCQEGLSMSGNDIQNNTVRGFLAQWNDWGLWAWPSASNNNKNNYINNSIFQLNTYAGMDIGRIGLNTFYNNIVRNNSFGIEIRQGAEPFFTMTLSYNSSYWDWAIEDTAVVDIYSTHILFPNITNTVASVTASISHDSGDGYWNLTTKPMIITIDAGTCDIIVTRYDDSYVQWTGTALAGDLTQYIGGLRVGRVYDLLVDGATTGRASVEAATMLEVATYRVTYPYTDGWSTKTFAVRLVTNNGEGSSPQDVDVPDQDLDSDGDGWTDAEEIAAGSDPYDATSTPLTVPPRLLGVAWYLWVLAIVAVVALCLVVYFAMVPSAWKKFKKLF